MKALPSRVIISYIFDYVIVIAFAIGFTLLDKVGPFRQHFSLQNYTLQYPFAEVERVPIKDAFIIVVIGPALVIIIWTLAIDGLFGHHGKDKYGGTKRMYEGWGWRGHSFKERLWELNCGILGLLLAVSGALVVTQALKNAAGKPRPDLIARCKPSVFQDAPVFGLSNSSICTETDNSIIWDGFRSWPSGHSSTSFAGLGYLSFYLTGKLHVLDTRGEVWKTILVLIPILGAALIAVSRIMDARHHPFDVISGAMFGLLFGWGAYRQYFPALEETWKKGKAYPIRSWGRDPLDAKLNERSGEDASEGVGRQGKYDAPAEDRGYLSAGARESYELHNRAASVDTQRMDVP